MGLGRPTNKLDFDRVFRRRKAVLRQKNVPKFCDSLFIFYRSDECRTGAPDIDGRYANECLDRRSTAKCMGFRGWNRAGRGDRSKAGYERGSKAKAFGPLLVLVGDAIRAGSGSDRSQSPRFRLGL
jgi:hypothetical protein